MRVKFKCNTNTLGIVTLGRLWWSKDYNIEYYDDRWYFISPDNVRFKCDSHLNRDLMFKMCEILPLPTYKVVI